MAATGLTMTVQRWKYFDFSISYLNDKLIFVTKRPPAKRIKFLAIAPFTNFVITKNIQRFEGIKFHN